MADSSTLVSETGRSLLADSSVLESKMIETSKENVFRAAVLDVEEEMPQIETRVVLVQEAGKREELQKALETIKIMEVPVIKIKESSPDKSEEKLIKSIIHMAIKMPYIKTDTIEELGDSDSPEFETIFVVSDFQAPIFSNLCKADCRVIGPPVLLHCAQKGEPLPFSCRPLYCASMLNLVLCFTGFRKKDELVKLVTLVHHMGGIIRRDFSSKVTHLVANSTHGDKFRIAVSLGIPIVKAEWIYKAWEKRNEIDFCAADDDFRNQFKVPPFQDCMLSFLGFSDDEKANMEEMTEMQGGHYLPVGDERCTHLVVEESTVKDLPFEPLKKLYVVKQEWFWGSIQMDARAGESMYLFEKSESPDFKKSVSLLSLSTPNSNRKRRRLKETLAQLTRETDLSPFPPRKRPSAEHSLSIGSLLDISNTPESSTANGETPKSCARPSKNSTPLPLKQSARWQVAKELYQTESNYVDILTTIIQLFQVPLEKEGQLGGPILAQEEIKTIFGSIPDILDVHTKIKEDLEDLMINWTESKSIGDIILKYSKDLLKTYPPFVNFFEMSKETITRCEKQKPRFHAFLKINQAKPECGRQSLAELLIRPVQRLPSVALLLNDIKKHTAEENPDKITLERAIESLKEVMTHINEDKRKTEAQRQFFDVVYEVDGCPANLLSSHRSLVQRLETVALGDDICDRGEQVTLFLFNDCLEIARKRHKVIGAFKSPHGHTRPPASLKHVVLMPLSQIKKVLDIRETEDCQKAFALVVRPPTELNNKLLSFQMTTEDPCKEDWLKMLCRHVANTICKADAENLIYVADPDSVEVNTKDMDSTLSRASRAIKKTSKKVTRAFSFSKTPKRALRRALMSHSATEGRSPSCSESFIGSRLTSASSLAIACSSSTCSLSGSAKCAVNVHRSSSVDWSSQSSKPRPVLCPGSPNTHLPNALEAKASSNLESLNGHALDRPCAFPVVTATCADAGGCSFSILGQPSLDL
ncbi:protein ECT2 isoform X2 [Ammospiza nelsoni]|uniref:protein ECT2 isoform X2 n=1 Tax=Ammospiza caudacuta TaxID=2857398 RepID=UPI0027399E77|nr:protein ECT2 isoform X2 [Ammospiza caudacuta]XP_059335530.1 protein ECT2 isoform X2 [Ammospiza nelsoni]